MTETTVQGQPRPAQGSDGPLLDIRGLRVDFPDIEGSPAIDGMDLTVGRGEIVALVGESGSGKSLTALTVMGLLPPGAEVVGGDVTLEDEDLLECLAEAAQRDPGQQGRHVVPAAEDHAGPHRPGRRPGHRVAAPAPQGGPA